MWADDRHHGRLRPHPVGRGALFALCLFAGVVAAGKELARHHGLWFITHISKPKKVRIVPGALRYYFVRHPDTLGILDDRTIGAHCVHVDDGDIRIPAGARSGRVAQPPEQHENFERYRPDRPDA